jgi:predicted nucleic acid-binding protein
LTVVIDAALVISGLTASGPDSLWCRRILENEVLMAPYALPLEVASALRWAEIKGELTPYVASNAHTDLLSLAVDYFPYHAFADRVWGLRANVSTADAWYVALAEWLNAPLATLDRRLTRASGPRCNFLTPET